MGMYKNIKATFREEYRMHPEGYKAKLVQWNKEPPVKGVERPTNIARARELGYKAKQGVLVARVSVKKGRRKIPTHGGGRKPSKSGRFFSRTKSLQAIAEERAGRKFSNCEVLNSYFVGEIGNKKFYEVLLLERSNPSICNDPYYKSIVAQRGRAQRGLTRAGKKYRGFE